MKRLIVLCLLVLPLAAVPLACGGDGGVAPDGGLDDAGSTGDATLPDAADDTVVFGDGNVLPDGGGNDGSWNCSDGGAGLDLGSLCKSSADCCSGNCKSGTCQPPACVSDNQACSQSSDCCSGTCGGGTCTPLNNTCKTLGNSCQNSTECCSQWCSGGVCSQPSYCGQAGDICTSGASCCGGLCTKAQNAVFGVCGQPQAIGAQCQMVDGVVCQGVSADGGVILQDGGVPTCGGGCCSRSCAPYGGTGVLICQPASGCRPVGDICANDSDCCSINNPKVYCNKASPNDPIGVCSNPSGCKPNGDICRLQTVQCNATDNCCTGNVQTKDTCHQDSLGVPRCSYAGDAGCTPSNGSCASSADCCNLNPCVPDGDGGFTCYPSSCVPTQGACTTDSDCCIGGHCYIQQGSTSGSCVPNTTTSDGGTTDGGTTTDGGCGYYGQVCTQSADCCNGVPCTNGRCEYPPPN